MGRIGAERAKIQGGLPDFGHNVLELGRMFPRLHHGEARAPSELVRPADEGFSADGRAELIFSAKSA
jgi:hypothetical protein